MFSRALFPLVALMWLSSLIVPGHADEKAHMPAEIADMEFEIKKRDLVIEMTEFRVKEAEIALERIAPLRQQAEKAGQGDELERLGLDRQQAILHVEMRKLEAQLAQIEFDQVQAKLKQVRQAVGGTGEPQTRARPISNGHVAELKKLLKQRRDVLRNWVEAVTAEYRSGTGNHAEVAQAINALLEAELEVTVDKAERIALHEQRVKSFKEQEEIAKAMLQVGRVNRTELFAATAARIKAEVEILRERASEK